MKPKSLGTLEKVDLRSVWASEPQDFTPWLAQVENLSILGDTLGLELELEEQEKGVGNYRADLVCKETGTDTWVLIENQLEKTNHNHLGQILTYAAGLNAVTIVWIAEKFTDEHQATLQWLNEISGEQISFFGIEIELWRIAGSPVAPRFNIVARPNDWTKGGILSSTKELTETKRLQKEFWREFVELCAKDSRVIRPQQPSPRHWLNITIGKSGVKLVAIASFYDSESQSYDSQEVRAMFELLKDSAKQNYELLSAEKAAIEREFGSELIWYNPENKKVAKIYVRKSADLRNRATWKSEQEWLLAQLEKLHKVFVKRLRKLL